MSIYIVLLIPLIHWIADFVLQSDSIAKAKSTCHVALIAHAFEYALVWLLPIFVCFVATGQDNRLEFFMPITFILHGAQDYFTSRLNSRLWSEGRTHVFFVAIGFDQLLHLTQLYLTFYFLT